MPFRFSLPRCFSSVPISSSPISSSNSIFPWESEQVQEAKDALRKAKSAHNQIVLDLVAKGFSAHYITDKSRRNWSETISVLVGLYSSYTVSMACHQLGLDRV
jgi:hypothetical protein